MKNEYILAIVFALATGFFWGTYGHALAQARALEKSPFKPYVMIGVAYLVWGVIGGLVGMAVKQDVFSFSFMGSVWGFIGGSLGAFGALALTLAMYNHGHEIPQTVLSIVFGTAVSVAAIVSVLTSKTQADPRMWVGIVGMAICIVTVAYYTPQPTANAPKPAAPPAASEPA